MDREYIVQSPSITAIADAIRTKTNTSDGITLEEMPEKIASINKKLSNITVRSQPATFVEEPAEGFDGIGSVTVEGDENLVAKNIKNGVTILGVKGSYIPDSTKLMVGYNTITKNGAYTFRPSIGYDGLSRHEVTVNVPVVEEVVDAVLQEKSVTPKRTKQTVLPDNGYDGLSAVTVYGDNYLVDYNIKKDVTIFGVTGTYENTVDAELQSKTVTPSRNSQFITPDTNYDGLSSVYIYGDSNLIASNIREDVTVFGVKGSYSTGQKYQSKTVTPTKNGFTVTADTGYNALAQVTVLGDSNLRPDKIAADEKIFGVTGTYVSPMKHITVIPSLDEQYILPTNGFYGFSSITVAPAEATGDYTEGFAAGSASRDEEIAELQARIVELQAECDNKYKDGYDAGYDAGIADISASYKDLDEVKY